MSDTKNITIAALYKFTPMENWGPELQTTWKNFMIDHEVKGTILLTPEGINGTISGPKEGVDATLDMLKAEPGLADLDVKFSASATYPFKRTKVKLRQDPIPLGVEVDTSNAGIYVEPHDWNDIISAPDVITIDTRNGYETLLGMFKGAEDPQTQTFKELPQWVKQNLDPAQHKRIAMYCTGGIRCEKSTAFMKELGFDEVYHLKGGILRYLEEIPKEESLWEGECYVFDDRVAVDHDLQPSKTAAICKNCGHSLIAADLKRPTFEAGVSCPNCATVHGNVQQNQPATSA